MPANAIIPIMITKKNRNGSSRLSRFAPHVSFPDEHPALLVPLPLFFRFKLAAESLDFLEWRLCQYPRFDMRPFFFMSASC